MTKNSKATPPLPRGARDTATAPLVQSVNSLPILKVQTTPLVPTLNAIR